MTVTSATAVKPEHSPEPASSGADGSSQPPRSTPNASSLRRDTVADELEQANSRLQAVRDRIAEGEHVTGVELAEAEQAVELAKLRMDAAVEHERRRAEAARVARLEELLAELNDGKLAAHATALLAEVRAVADQLSALFHHGGEFRDELHRIVGEIARLGGDLPDGVRLESTSARPRSTDTLKVNGATWRADRDLGLRLVADAIAIAALETIPRGLRGELLTPARNLAPTRGLGEKQVTYAEAALGSMARSDA